MSTQQLSFVKSTVRIFGYVAGAVAFGDNPTAYFAFAVLIVSEIIGVVEELGRK